MRILWIPHHPLGTTATRTRTEHLLDHLAHRHEIDVLSFSVHGRDRLRDYIVDVWRPFQGPRRSAYKVVKLLRFPRLARANSRLLNATVRRELRGRGHDVIVASPVPYLLGDLEFEGLGAPVVCDLLDGTDWRAATGATRFESEFAQKSAAVMAVSHGLVEQARKVNARVEWVPNGVDLQRYRAFRASTADCKRQFGLRPSALTISLIGLTCSPRLYFIEAVLAMARSGHDVQLVLVGEGQHAAAMRRAARASDGRVLFVGAVPYAEILPWFQATDVGVYPCEDSPYYHLALPLKVLEYAAVGKPVLIAPRLAELERIGLRNFRYSPAHAEGFREALEECTPSERIDDPRLEEFDWDRIAKKVEALLEAVVASPARAR